MPHILVRADRFDYWIRRHVVPCNGRAERSFGTGRRTVYLPRRHWLDFDPVALAVLLIGMAMIELLALII
jgi:hypothetical protein